MTTFAYSLDEEIYFGEYDTPREALDEAANAAEDDGHTCVWIANIVPAKTLVVPNWLGEQIRAYLDEQLADNIGGDDAIVDMTDEQETALGKIIIDWLDANGCFTRWGVVHPVRHDIAQERE
jgi:hypothetical protein